MNRGGLPHSEIFGSKLVCSSPKLFAACHVLHRLLAPRHPPYALSSLTIETHALLHVIVVGKNYRLQSIQLRKISCCRPRGRHALLFTQRTKTDSNFQRARLRPSGYGAQPSHFPPSLPAEARFASPLFRPGITGAKAGGEYRARTGDLLVANQALSQLS